MSQLVRDKAFYKQLAQISFPIALQNLIGLGVNMTDTVMLSSLGGKQISASALANQPFFVLSLFLFGLSSGASVLTAQYWGKGDTKTISKIIGLTIKVSILFSLIFAFFVIIFPRNAMLIYTNDKGVIEYGIQYLKIIGISYIMSAISTTFMCVIRSIENVKAPLFISIVVFVVNTFLNWILIYGKFGLPALGIRGSATSTLIARTVELTLVLIYVLHIEKVIKFKIKEILSFDRQLFFDFLHYSVPVVINETLWGVGMTMQSVIVGHMGYRAVTANSIASVVQRLSSVYIFGIANASAVIVGKLIGSGNIKKAQDGAFTLLFISAVSGILSSIIIILLRYPAVMFYNVDRLTKTYAENIMLVFAVIVFFSSFNCSNIVGVLRGGGDTRFALAIDISTMWIVALPLGAVAGLIYHLPVPLVFSILFMDEPVKFIIGLFRFKSGKWLRNVTR